MATLWDTTKVLSEFGNAFDISNAEKPAMQVAKVAAPEATAGYKLGQRAAQFMQGNSFLSKLFRSVPGISLAGEAAVDAVDGNTAGAVARGALALGSVAGGAPGKALAAGFTGGELAAQGVASFAEAMNPTSQVLAPKFAEEVRKAGGAAQYTQDAQARIQATQDATAQQMTAERTARVNQVIADSRQVTAQENADAAASDRYERRMEVERKIAGLQRPDAALYRGGFAALPQLFAQTADYVSKRGQLQRVAKQEFEADEKAKDRLSNEAVNAAKLQLDFRKAMKPDIKIATVKSGLSEQPVILKDDTPVSTLTVDDKGRVTSQPVAARPTTAQAHAEAKAKIEAASNKAYAKEQVNKRLKDLGYPTLP